MNIISCSHKNCLNWPIVYSDKCGLHTTEDELEEILQKLESGGVHDNVNLSRVTFNNRTFKESVFKGFIFQEAQMTSCEFHGCQFIDLSEFTDCNLDDVRFHNCTFQSVEFDNANLAGIQLHDCKLIECSFNQTHIIYESIIKGTEFHKFTFSGSTIDNTAISSSSWILGKFSVCSIEDSIFVKSKFLETEFNLTNLYDSQFKDCTFRLITHDFGFTSTIRLCRFQSPDYEDFILPDDFNNWNSTDDSDLIFYNRLISKLTREPNINHLGDLNKILERVERIDVSEVLKCKSDVFNLYQDLYTEARIKADYMYYSLLMKGFSDLPSLLQKSDTLFLPQPQQQATKKALLYLSFQVEEMSLMDLIEIQMHLREIEETLHDYGSFEIVDIQKGSFLIILSGASSLILVTLFFICKYGLPSIKDLLDIKLKHQEIQKNKKAIEDGISDDERKQEIHEVDIEFKKAAAQKQSAETAFIKEQTKALRSEEKRREELHYDTLDENKLRIAQLKAKGIAMTQKDKLELEKLEKDIALIEQEMITDILELDNINVSQLELSPVGQKVRDVVSDLKENYKIELAKVILPDIDSST